MKVIINKFLPIGRRYYAINICGMVFAKGPCDEVMLNHEAIHTAQMKELLILGFYLLYVWEWLYKSLRLLSFYRGYLNISFEREAYENAGNPNYLSSRRPYAFGRYL